MLPLYFMWSYISSYFRIANLQKRLKESSQLQVLMRYLNNPLKFDINIISSATRGSGNVCEHPLPYLQTHPPCLRILDQQQFRSRNRRNLDREIQVIGPRNIMDQIKIEVKSHLVKSGLQGERITTHFTARCIIISLAVLLGDQVNCYLFVFLSLLCLCKHCHTTVILCFFYYSHWLFTFILHLYSLNLVAQSILVVNSSDPYYYELKIVFPRILSVSAIFKRYFIVMSQQDQGGKLLKNM